MRRTVVVAVAVMMALSLAGCGGGGSDTGAGDASPSPSMAGTTTPAVSAVTQASDDLSSEASDTISPLEEQKFVAFPTDEDVLPDAVKQRLDAAQPILIFFGDATQKTNDDQAEAIDAVMGDYRGLISLVSFDVGKYVTSDQDGKIEVKAGMENDPTAKKVARLLGSDYLNIKFTPYLVFVNSDGYITHRVRGYVDSALIEREVLRATE